jgi:SAM-dependent methyltransferase
MKFIYDEEPSVHWGFFYCLNKTVLDLGCGYNAECTPTPVYFLRDQKAKHVIGVDCDKTSIQRLQALNLENFTLLEETLDSAEKIRSLLEQYSPQIVKIDIEGAEALLGRIGAETMKSVQQIAIEYHDNHTRLVVEKVLNDWGFPRPRRYGLFNLVPTEYGVFFTCR